MKLQHSIFILFTVFLFSACTATKKAGQTTATENITADYLVKKLQEQSIDYEWFEGRSRMRYIDMTQNRSIKAVIRMKKDSLIWMSFQLLGLEGARVLMTPDTVHVINRLNKEYYVKPLNYVEEVANIPADFKAIQALLVGNPVLYPTTYELENRDSVYLLSTDTIINTTYQLASESYQLQNLTLKDENNQKVDMAYENYQELETGQIFSMMRDIIISSPTRGNASVQIEYSRVQFDVPKTISFNVPDSYKRVD